SAWCGPASLNNSELLTQVHLDYINAGADVITANTFASSRLMLTPAGFADRVEEINRIAVEAALRARDLATEKSPSRKIAVAGSLSHMVPVAAGTAKVDVGRDYVGASIDVVEVHLRQQFAVVQRRWPAPSRWVHLSTATLKFCASCTVENYHFARIETPLDIFVAHRHQRLTELRVLAHKLDELFGRDFAKVCRNYLFIADQNSRRHAGDTDRRRNSPIFV
ncbi:MAG: hypothetical protein EBV75_06150, partial [Acidimicrobiia bacterium]|nr:hypothetical protein [Acidimicrobiia bacterium]